MYVAITHARILSLHDSNTSALVQQHTHLLFLLIYLFTHSFISLTHTHSHTHTHTHTHTLLAHSLTNSHTTHTQAVSGPAPPHREAAIACLDLLLRWITLRFFDTNTTVNMKCLEFLHIFFQMLIGEESFRMSDYEAQAFIPYLVQKVGGAYFPGNTL